MERHAAQRPAPYDEAADEDPHAFLYWTLRMAEHTYRRLLAPPLAVPSDLLADFRAALADRPAADTDNAQLHIDPESSVRRGLAARDRLARLGSSGFIAIGDDDAVTVVLALLGVRDLAAVDIDPRLLEWLVRAVARAGASLEAERADVFDDPVPPRFAARFALAAADPPRCFEDAVDFLRFGARCLRRDAPASMLWADHADWNFEHGDVLDALPELGFTIAEVHELFHAYPPERAWLPDPDAKARELGVDSAWLRALVSRVPGWTHLYVLDRDQG